jgi:hypothetical protein
MVIAFSTNKSGDSAGINLTKKFSHWIEEMSEEGKRVEIVNVNSSGNKNGWMMIVQYQIIEDTKKK